MKAEWDTYLESIGVQGLFRKRVEDVVDFYQEVYPGQIEDIFVTEYFDKDENRQYESLWFFSESSMMEAKQFLKEDDLDSAVLRQQVKYWTIKKTEYDFQEVTTKSRMVLQFSLLSGVVGALKASRENCAHLKRLFFKHIISNEIEGPSAAGQVEGGDGQ